MYGDSEAPPFEWARVAQLLSSSCTCNELRLHNSTSFMVAVDVTIKQLKGSL